jgi:hyaluronate lyase
MIKKLPLLLGTLLCLLVTVTRADEYDTLRDKWKLTLTGGTSYNPADTQIAATIARIDADCAKFLNGDAGATPAIPAMLTTGGTGRAHLWSDLASTTISSHITSSYSRLKAMTLAYSTYGSSYYQNATLLGHITGGLDWLYANRYNETITTDSQGNDITPYDNTWDWRIGVPMAYNDIMVMLYDDLQSAPQMSQYAAAVEVYANDTFYTSGSSTGANKVWRCMVVAVHGILTKDSSELVRAKTDLVAANADVFDYVGSGDGFYTDGSFVQHQAHPYNGGYGVVAIYYGAELLNLLAGSTWEVTDAKADNIFDWVYDAYEPLIYKGVMFTSVMGRNAASYDVNRGAGVSDHLASHKVIWALIRLAEFAAPADAAAYKSMAKHWILADTSALGFYADASVDVTVKAKAIVADSAVPDRGELSLYKQYPRMDRVAVHRTGYAFGLSLSSSRIYNYESINSQNLKGWNTGSGMSYLYNADLDQFTGNYWATVNPYRLPGTTVLQATTVGHRKLNGQTWVGGTQVGDLFGVTGMQFRWPEKSLYAKKSWFMFDDEIVALGADIDSAEAAKVVETVVENRKLTAAGDNDFQVNGTLQSETLTTSVTTHTGVNWAHLAGSVSGSDIGYYFPGTATVYSRREARTGYWDTIDDRTNVPHTAVTDNYLNVWFDHGTTPTDAAYAYVLLPNKTSSQVSTYAGSPHITILENSGQAQAVKENTLGITAINFWQNVSKTVGGVTTADASSFIMLEDDATLDIGLSDPTQTKTGAMGYTIAKQALSLNTALTSSGVSVTQLHPSIQFTVNMASAKGGTKRVAFTTAVIVDDDNNHNTGGSTAAGSPGAWTPSTNAGDWETGFVHDNNTGKGSSKYFTFTPNIPVSGTYEVGFWYAAHAWRANNVPVDIVGSTGTTTVTVNQQANGSQWFSLGTYHFNAGTGGRVVVKTIGTSGGSGGNSYVAADAVRFLPVTLDAPVSVTVDSNNANNTGGSTATATAPGGSPWGTSTGAGNHGGDYYHDGNTGKGSTKYVTFTPDIPSAGNYEVFIWHVSHANRATNVPVDVNGSGGTSTVTVNQQINGSQWVSLGTYAFAAGTAGNVVVRTTGTNGYVVADGVRFVKL